MAELTREEPVSLINSLITKSYLQTKPEYQYFERKGLGTKPSKIADELIGMLNADGGVLAFGVSDNGEIEDISILPNLADYRKLIFDFIKPVCDIQLEEVFVDGKLIFLFHVEQDLERVFSRADQELRCFLRVADSNRELNWDGIKKLEYDKTIRFFEDEKVVDFDIDDLDVELLKDYKERIAYKGDVLDLLCKKNLAIKRKDGEFEFKKAAILLFSQNPEKYIPNASARYIRYEGTEQKAGMKFNVVKQKRFENNILRLIEEIKAFMHISLKDYYFLDIVVGRFIQVLEYPEAAWLEGIVNALCHRSYNIAGNTVDIKHYDDRLEISNSGPLPAQVTLANIKTERYARNPRVARVLEDFGYVRQLNEGVSRIYEVMEESMLAEPEYSIREGNVYLVLRNCISQDSRLISDELKKTIELNWKQYNETQQKALRYLFVRGRATLAELAQHTDIHINNMRRYINGFIADGILVRLSDKERDKNAQYAFNKMEELQV